jgi:DNA polymerase delta subunit 3
MVEARATFTSIFSVHIYSLQSSVLQDLNVLTDVGREMRVAYGHEDPLEYGKQCGIIQNKNVTVR